MARPKGTDTNARERLIKAAGRGFKTGGYGGIGVDALAKEAGLTSGAFYSHLGSKAAAFKLAITDGMAFLQSAIAGHQTQHGADWPEVFVDFYLGDRMTVGLDKACTVPSLSADVSRADAATRAEYDRALIAIVEMIAQGPGDAMGRDRALAFLSTLTGAANMARAVSDETLRREMLDAAAKAAKAIASGRKS